MLTTTTSSSPDINPNDSIFFPSHPLFKIKPPLSFDDYIPGGILVSTSSLQNTTTPDTITTTDTNGDDLPNAIELDSTLVPTVNLLIPHSLNRPPNHRKRINATVTKVAKDDAWKLGKDGLLDEEWKEVEGSWKGVFGLEKRPFDRALRALEQFFNSRSIALNRRVHYPIARRFRNATLLQPSNAGPHIPGPLSLPPGTPIREEEENCLFLIDMERSLKRYWKEVMEDSGKGWNLKTAYDSFEIFNSFLHYLSLGSFLPESHFSLPLTRLLPISRSYLRRMLCAGMIYQSSGAIGGSREEWCGVVINALVKKIDEEWRDEGWKKLGEEDWEKEAKEFRSNLEEEEKKKKEKGNADAKQVEEEVQGVGDWEKSVGEPPEKLIAVLTTEEATIKMQLLIAPSRVSNFKCTQTHTAANGIITSASITTSTTQLPFPCLIDLIRLEISIQPAEGTIPVVKAVVYVDRSQEMMKHPKGIDSIVDAAVGLRIVGTFVEIRGVRDDGEEVGFWVIVDVDKVSPPLEE